ncbi:MAG: metallophosphoesterase [Gammaproteobacteria bacterium]|nr:metallophosphoesterase [Gammaproteobacteria bacterium]
MPSATVYRIAHISDPHLTTLSGIRPADVRNKRILGYLSWLWRRRREHRREVLAKLIQDVESRRPDHVVITGDLTHVGTPSECAEAATWLQETSGRLPLTLIPGNHDRYVSAPWSVTTGRWADYMVGDGGDTALEQDMFPSLRRRGPVAIIGLTSAVPSPPFFATGRIGDNQLEACERLLNEAGRAGLFRLLLVHHPPAPNRLDWRRSLIDAGRLRKILKRAGTELVLHGHCHRWLSTSVPGPLDDIPALGIPSASALTTRAGRRAGYSMLEITPAGFGWEVSVACYALVNDTTGFQLHDLLKLQRPKRPDIS